MTWHCTKLDSANFQARSSMFKNNPATLAQNRIRPERKLPICFWSTKFVKKLAFFVVEYDQHLRLNNKNLWRNGLTGVSKSCHNSEFSTYVLTASNTHVNMPKFVDNSVYLKLSQYIFFWVTHVCTYSPDFEVDRDDTFWATEIRFANFSFCIQKSFLQKFQFFIQMMSFPRFFL
jgi:hypothetical protein